MAVAVKLTRHFKFVWGLASFGLSLISGIFAALLPIFYQDYLGLSARWIGTAMIVYAVWNAVNDPIFGQITDSTRSRWGRRIPYMRFTAPFLGLTFVLVWFAPVRAGQETLFWWMLGSMLLYDTCYTIIGLVYSALLPEISESDSERNGLQISSTLFGLLGTLFGFLIPDFFRPKADALLECGIPSFLPLQLAMIVVAVFAVLFILYTTFKVRERPEFSRVDQSLPLGKSLRFTFTNRAFLFLVSANFMVTLMQATVTGTLFYLADYVLKVDTIYLLIWMFVPLMLAVPVTPWLRSRFGVAGAQQLLCSVSGVGLILLTFAPNDLVFPCIALAGFGVGGVVTLMNVLFAQVADEDELQSGVRREGMFFGINAFVTKPAESIAIAMPPIILELTQFVTRESNNGQIFLDQPASAVFGIRMMVGLIPGIVMLIGALLLFGYPLRGEYLRSVQARVLDLHAAKHEKLVRGD